MQVTLFKSKSVLTGTLGHFPMLIVWLLAKPNKNETAEKHIKECIERFQVTDTGRLNV